MPTAARIPAFAAPLAEDDSILASTLLHRAGLDAERESRIDDLARRLIAAIRAQSHALGGVEDMLREFSLSTREGLALMVLAEALLRVPDAATADALILDKLGQGDFAHHAAKSGAMLVNASAWALGVSARLIQPGEMPDSILTQLARRIGLPALRTATRQAMRLLGNHFVLGQTIGAALQRAASAGGRLYRYSFDMLGEGARTAADAQHYLAAYAGAVEAIGRSTGSAALPSRPGLSVKLSALHPRYEAVSAARVLRELPPRLLDLARVAKAFDLNLTVDAEEADRLELSLDVIAATLADPSLAGWEGFGLAIQSYQKRALKVIDWVDDLAAAHGRRLMVRLVKGAYWDTEIKRAQERGLDNYPVFTRKAMTDLNYLACAERLLALRPRLYPQFATHNALSVASIVERAGSGKGFEFQRLHGMGEELYGDLLQMRPDLACRTYAPVGGHRELLAYLVRRLLENGANTSFVSVAADPNVPVETLLKRPATVIGHPDCASHPLLPPPPHLFGTERINSRGIEFGHRNSLAALVQSIEAVRGGVAATCLVNGMQDGTAAVTCTSPVDSATTGSALFADHELVERTLAVARSACRIFSTTTPRHRARMLECAADLIEARAPRFLHLLQVEGGRTLDDAVSEVREAVDFCRYYAAQARHVLEPLTLVGPTGESNELRLRPRGVFVAISPWNFPMAIFTGQIAAALAAGNCVVAKPAEQTPLIAFEVVRLMHEAGFPGDALQLVLGDGAIGARLVASPQVDGVAFTGSVPVAQTINRALAARDGPIIPLIAETGGINAMLVDATALPEQVCDDVVISAFRSAGQRCSALRLLFLQEDVADRMIALIVGAARELKVGDPRDPATHVGPVIDADAKARLDAWIASMRTAGHVLFAGHSPPGLYVAPHIMELPDATLLRDEIFGPVLHVVRYRAEDLDQVLDRIEAMRYGLTLGVQSRIQTTVDRICARLDAGNVYVNRNMIGAVVGVQPFGGSHLSGTGPKAGGPHYLQRFVIEQTVSTNTAASGGNASLIGMRD